MTPTREQLAEEIEEIAGQLWRDLCEGDGQHSEALDKSLIRKHMRRLAAACLAAPPQATPEPQAMPPIEPGDWVRLAYGRPNPELVVGVREDDPSLHDETVDLSGFGWTRLSEITEIRKANSAVWTREQTFS